MSEVQGIKLPERGAPELAPVRRSVWSYIALMALLQIATGWFLFAGPARLLYAAIALPWTAVVGYILAANVHLLYTPEGRSLNKLNLATRVTLLRVLAIPMVCMLIDERRLAVAGLVFLIAALTDWLDGFLARRMHEVTQLGRMVDPSIDAVICFFTFGALFASGYFAAWFIILVMFRYGILLGGALGLKAALGRLPVRATFMGRLFYFIQYIMLALFLLSDGRVPEPAFTLLLAFVQVAVSVQLLGLGMSLYRENRS